MRRIVAGMCVCSFVVATCFTMAATKELAVNYWPLVAGSRWSMPIPDENPGWVVTFHVTKVVPKAEGVSDVSLEYSMNGNQVQKEVYEVTADMIARMSGGPNGGSDFNPPMPVIKLPMNSGASWSWSGTIGSGLLQHPAASQFSVSGPVEVTTPAGKFNAIKVHSALVLSSGKKSISLPNDTWYAPGVGIVEQQAKVNGKVHTYYLSKYSVK